MHVRAETHTKRQLAGRWGPMNLNCVRREKNILYTELNTAAKAGQKSLTSTTSTTNQTRKDIFHLFSLSSHLPLFQQLRGAIPLQSLCIRGSTVYLVKLIQYCISLLSVFTVFFHTVHNTYTYTMTIYTYRCYLYMYSILHIHYTRTRKITKRNNTQYLSACQIFFGFCDKRPRLSLLTVS